MEVMEFQTIVGKAVIRAFKIFRIFSLFDDVGRLAIMATLRGAIAPDARIEAIIGDVPVALK